MWIKSRKGLDLIAENDGVKPMNESDLELLRKELHQRREEIFSRLQDLEEGWRNLSEPDIEVCDEAQKAALSELYNRLDRQELAAVEEIDRALAKMAAADYGRCEQCAKTIP